MREASPKKNSEGLELNILYRILMKVYHQPYSELRNIPYRDALFLVHSEAAEQDYMKQEIEKSKKNTK
ncbi:hypothetical protein LCGC14_0956520 [marine sediment metagenome]|uniref:Uncharacterized protein n=1 Tax=marine sediment metagenome TaxID=412755 RepID=A0A0F9NFN8_9ZZZZ